MVSKFIFNQSINDIVKKRKSVRTYKKEEVKVSEINKLKSYISTLKGPFKEKVTFKIIDSNEHINGSKLGTYGVIKGANKYVAVKVQKGKYDFEQLGYEMESLVLYATSLGINTCWIGGTFKKSEFAKAMEVSKNEVIPVVSPIGYEADKKSIVEKTIKKLSKCDRRKPWGEIFFLRDFSCPLTEYCTLDKYKDILENVRLAPSALNKQPWRIVKCGENFHFFVEIDRNQNKESNYYFQRIDIGIAMCHFDLSCKEMGLKGSFKVIDPEIKEIPNKVEYFISWIKE